MALSAAATEFHKILGVLGIARIAALFGVAGRTVRHWRSGDRHLPRGAHILVHLIAAGMVSIEQVEQAAVSIPARANGGGAKGEPPAPLLVEPAPEQSVDPSRTTAEKIVALAPNACRWPYNDPRHPNFYFCSRPTAAPPYCNEHRIAAHMTQAPSGGQKPDSLAALAAPYSSRDGTGHPSHDVGGPRAAPVALSV